jgi:hypothetical protein
METNQAIQKIERKIPALKTRSQELGPMRPGSVSAQYNVCGKPGCRRKDPQAPRRHGPDYQLNYIYQGNRRRNLSAGKT